MRQDKPLSQAPLLSKLVHLMPKISLTDSLIRTGHSGNASRTDTSQPSNNSATTTFSWLSKNYPILSITNLLLRAVPIVAARDQATTGNGFKSANHKLSSQRSRSGMALLLSSYTVWSSMARTVQLCYRLDMTGLLLVTTPTQCIYLMESASSATHREATAILPTTTTFSWSLVAWSEASVEYECTVERK